MEVSQLHNDGGCLQRLGGHQAPRQRTCEAQVPLRSARQQELLQQQLPRMGGLGGSDFTHAARFGLACLCVHPPVEKQHQRRHRQKVMSRCVKSPWPLLLDPRCILRQHRGRQCTGMPQDTSHSVPRPWERTPSSLMMTMVMLVPSTLAWTAMRKMLETSCTALLRLTELLPGRRRQRRPLPGPPSMPVVAQHLRHQYHPPPCR